MEQLSMLDAGFLHAEDSDRHVSLAIGGLAVVEGPIPDHRELVATLAERLIATPRFTQILVTHPLDLTAPEWVDDPAFDLAHHLRRAALPHPGGEEALYRLTAEIMERRLDRDRPLWECWIIEGLPEGRWALLTKIHHCMADGISASQVLNGLCDGGQPDTFANRIHAAQPHGGGPSWPGLNPLRWPGLNPLRWAGDTWRLSTAVTGMAVRTAGGAAQLIGGLVRPAAASSLNGPVSSLRRYVAVRVPMEDVNHICRRFDVTINEVALTAISESFRTVLINRGEQPRRDSLRTLIPVAVRVPGPAAKPDNRVSVMLPFLPVEQTDPVERLTTVHRRLERAKRSGQRQAGSVVVSAGRFVPYVLTAWIVRLATRLPQRGVVTLATNIPGPRRTVRIMGAEVVELLPIPPMALRLRTAVAMLSYAGDLTFGILADFDSARDLDVLAEGISHAVARLAEIADSPGATEPASLRAQPPGAASAPGSNPDCGTV